MSAPLAIIGMACRTPGASDYRELWANVESGSTGMVRVDEEDLRREGVHLDPAIGNRYVPVAAPLNGFDAFDHAAFGIGAGEASGMSPDHRVFMEVVLEALEDAGCDPVRHAGRIGLFGAGGAASPRAVLENLGDPRYGEVDRPIKVSEALNWGALLDNDFLATRIAYALNLRGPCLTVQTACSSSLVALHLAIQSIVTGDSDIAIAGGVSIESPHRVGYYHQEGSIWSSDGACRPFDRAASGTIAGSGAGAVVVKGLAEALSDGDAIHAVILGSAINNDGNRKVGFTAPSVNQQAEVIRAALAAADLSGSEIGYVETHGTATEVGDLVEWTALERALGPVGLPCGLGATKANVGHLGSAAGIVGLIKAALVVQKGQMPPIANFEELNPRIVPQADRLFVPLDGSPWLDTATPRRAGVSSMGIGGTNAHVVLQQPPDRLAGPVPAPGAYFLPVSAASLCSAEGLATAMEDFAALDPQALPALARTVTYGRRTLQHREGVVISHRVDGVATWRTGPRTATAEPTIAMVLPGQAARMGDLSAAIAGIEGFRDLFAEACEGIPAVHRAAVEQFLTGAAAQDASPLDVELASLVQGVVVAKTLIETGIEPRALCGFSLGEVSAAIVSGVVTMVDAATTIAARARILSAAPAGAMIRVGCSEASAAAWLADGVSLGIVPDDSACMLSGEAAAVSQVAEQLSSAGIPWAPIPVRHPFHSEVLAPFVSAYAEVWSNLDLRRPTIPLVSPMGGGWLDDATAVDPEFWASHLTRQVRFGDAIRELRSAGVGMAFVLDSERGLTPFVRAAFGADTVPMVVGGQTGFDDLSRTRFVASAWSAGRDDLLEVETVRGDLTGSRPALVHAPTYRFDRAAGLTSPSPTEPASPYRSSAEPLPAAEADTASREAFEVVDRVRRVVAEVSGAPISEVDPAASFLELGYDSFLLIQLADALSDEFRHPVDVRLLYFDVDSSNAVANLLAGAVGSGAVSSPPVLDGEPALKQDAEPDGGGRDSGLDHEAGAGEAGFERETAVGSGPLPAELTWAQRTPISKRVTEEDRFALADQRNLVSGGGRLDVSYPVVGVRGDGARFTDVDGREYLDTCMGFGVLLLGHAAEPLTDALRSFRASDLLIGPQSSTAGEVARGIASLTGVDRVAFTSSGTEAVMGAVRAARAHTGRDLVSVFSGSYHGTFDGVLVTPRAGGEQGEAATLGRGTPSAMVRDVIVLPYDDTAIPILESHGERLAAVLVEPVQSRRPAHQPAELLHQLRDLTAAQGAALIFDEVITGFRCHPGGAAALFGVRPDLVTYGKVLGGGMPIGVIAGDAEFMSPIDGGRWRDGDGFPQRPSMVFAGTFSKHPLTMAVAGSMLGHLKRVSPGLQAELTQRTADLASRINAMAVAKGHPITVEHFSSLFRIEVKASVLAEDMLFLAMLNRGVYVWEGRTCFLSAAHTDEDCSEIVDVVAEAADEVARSGLWGDSGARSVPQSSPPSSALAPAAAPSSSDTSTGGAPLSDGQTLLWMAAEVGGDLAESYVIQDGFRIDATVDPERLRRAIAEVSRRHGVLRMGFDEDGTTQTFHEGVVPHLTVTDLGAAGPDEVMARLSETVAVPDDLSFPSLFAFHLVRTDGASYVHVTAPHCIVDGWSIELMWTELATCYEVNGRGDALADPASFLDFARWKRAEEDALFVVNDPRWREILLAAWESTTPVPGRGPWRPTIRVDPFPDGALGQLQDVARRSGCTLHNAGLAAVAMASSLLTGSSVMVAQAHQAGQPRYTDAPLMGFCVDLLPVVVDIDPEASLLEVATAVQRQVLDRSPHTSGLYRTMHDQAFRLLPAELWGYNYDRLREAEMFGGAVSPLTIRRDVVPWPATITIEERAGSLELISEISDASALADHGIRLAELVAVVLSDPSRPFQVLRDGFDG